MEKRKLIIMAKHMLAFALIVVLLSNAGVSLKKEVLASPLVYAWGSSGDKVREIQTRLKSWGYYSGNADGKFGQLTFDAVKLFQKRNNLTVDGIVGPKTLEKLGLPTGIYTPAASETAKSPQSSADISANEANVWLLACLINGEGRGEPYIGQVAIGAVVMNRVKSPAFPDTISGVIYQPGAFDAVKDGQINLEPTASCVKAARDAINGFDPTEGALFYWNPLTATSKWVLSLTVTKTIQNHVFAKS